MDTTHLHLLLNHFPTIGFIIGLGLFVSALIARSDHVKQAALVIFVAVALITIPTYVTGNAAAEKICVSGLDQPCDDATVSKALIEAHESAALMALFLMEFTGAFAWLGLWQYRRVLRLPTWNALAVLLLAAFTLAVVSQAANLGGEIRHPEIRALQEVASAGEPFGRQVGNYVRDTPWAWVASETLHFVGLSLLVGVFLLINLRTLGIARSVPFRALDRLLPWAILGFGVNVITGMLFFAAAPQQYTDNPAFYWKLIFVLVAGATTLYFFFDRGWASAADKDAPAFSKLVAASALVLWVGVMYWGSMLPFIGNAF